MRLIKVLALCCLVGTVADRGISAQPGGYGGGIGGGGGGLGTGARGELGNQGRGAQGGARGGMQAAPKHAGVKTRNYVFEPTGEKLSYSLFVPPRKLDKNKPVPLVIALHGSGGGPESIINALASAADKHDFILVGPMGYTETAAYGFERRLASRAERETSKLSEMDVMNVLGIMRAEFNIDPRRIYVVGASMGGVGAVHLALKYKDVWAAVGVISPAITSNVPEEFERYNGAPVVVLHGDSDDSVPIDLVRGWVAKLKELNVPTQYYEFRGGTHGSVLQQGGERVFAFLEKQARPAAAPNGK